ncbi:ABC transporter permease [Arundinibacter roseus]|uniref:ABC transporter permease n=1 Tax=Arundinibacter roseus TaxID=2070510 RepID=A0A4R4KDC8_9BACT|nr:ABC transporter permease [Arundinibacter roseus]TDB65914.1 ABC transporter permease [Arundinibacter roseus]
MIKNYFKIAYRNLVRNKVYSFINIVGLATGMAVAIMIGLWMQDELTYNQFHKNHQKIAQVYQSQTFNGVIGTGSAIPRPLEMTLRNEFADNFKHIIMSSWNYRGILTKGDTKLVKNGNFMQDGAADMLSLEILNGQAHGVQDPNSILLNASTAKALFGKENPVGQVVKLNNLYNMKVTGVYADVPSNSSFGTLDFLAPWSHLTTNTEWIKNSVDSWGNNSFQLFVQLSENATMGGVTAKIKDIKKRIKDTAPYKPELFLHPMDDWYLQSRFENGVSIGGRIQYVWLFGTIGGFVLLLACINFMNLSTARSEKRAREVGIRKSVGSQKRQLIFQFLSESFLVVSLAFVLALAMVLVFLSPFNTLSDKSIEFPWTSLWFWVSILAFVFVTALLSGSYPALYLSSFQPVKVLKGTFKAGRFAALPRKVLVVMQFTVSVALIIGTILVFRQIQYSKNRPVGYDRNGLVQIPLTEHDFEGKYDLMRSEFIKSGSVIEMSSSSSPTTDVYSNRSGFIWEGKPEGFQEDLAYTAVSVDFVKSLGLKIIAGRDFSREFATDSNAVILNKTAVKYMGLTNPVGTIIKDDDEEDPNPPMTVIGVIDDMIMQSPYEPVKQSMYVFDKFNNASYYNLRLNPAQNSSESMKVVEDVYKKHFPDLPFQFQFVDQEYAAKFAAEERIGKLAGVFTGLAVLISCLGLFGLASFMAEQRTKEVGVRKVLGASVMSLWGLLSKDFVQLVLISLLLAVPVSWYGMHQWLQKYTYHIEVSWWVFVVAGAGAIAITLLTVSFQAIKAALMNPVESLRSE